MAQQKEVVRFGPLARFIANGVRTGNVIHLSGQVSVDEKGQVVGAGDWVAQVEQAYVNITEVLGKFGATMQDVVDETVFITDVAGFMDNLAGYSAAREKAYGGEPDVTQTMVQVAALVMPGLLLEIKCVAHV